jgi:aryl sulfotransferase
MSHWIEAQFDPIGEVLARLEAQPHRRFIKTHTPADGIPFFPGAKYVFVARDGRDAFMSMCNHMERFRTDVREELIDHAISREQFGAATHFERLGARRSPAKFSPGFSVRPARCTRSA